MLTFQSNVITVHTRKRPDVDGAWVPDAVWPPEDGGDPVPRYRIVLRRTVSTRIDDDKECEGPDKPPDGPCEDEVLESEIADYGEKAASFYERIDMVGFRTRVRAPIRVEEIYIPLNAAVDTRVSGKACFSDSKDAAKCLEEAGAGKPISLPDAFLTSEKLGRRGIVILGDPGSGKTTHLKRLMLWCLRGGLARLGLPEDLVPVFLPLRDLKDLDGNLGRFIQSQLANPQWDVKPDFGERLMKRGRLLFLFDGLDEVADTRDRERVARLIEDTLRLDPKKTNRFVVTCRFAGYTPETRLDEEFLELHIRDLTEDQSEEFVRTWYRLVEEGLSEDREQARIAASEGARDLIERLRQKEFRAARVMELTRNPLLLTNICLVHRDRGGRLPKRRARLYDECIDVLLELWRGAKKLPVEMEAAKSRRILQAVAYWLHQEENRTRATAAELAGIIDPVLEIVGEPESSAEEFLKAVRDQSGLLTGWDQENFGFMHLGFQEYLTAQEIRRLAYDEPSELGRLAEKFGSGWWQEVGLLLLALDNPCLFERYMAEVVQRPEFASRPDLVDLCVEDAAEKSPAPFVAVLEIGPGNDRDLWKRQLAAFRVLPRIDPAAAKEWKTRLADHPYEEIRRFVGAGPSKRDLKTIVNQPSGYELVKIPGGDFMMGAPESEQTEWDEERPVHRVEVPTFYMGRYPVTNREYARYLEANPNAKEPEYWSDRNFNQPRQPVVGVAWKEARAFAEWAGLRLPSEAEWEYACRAGSQTRYCNGDTEEDLDRVGWYEKNSGGKLHPVGEKEPNRFGLYDMHGNVWEWVEDHWHSNYDGAPNDGSAWVDDISDDKAGRVSRGGGFLGEAVYCRSAFRSWLGVWYHLRGFRLARSVTL